MKSIAITGGHLTPALAVITELQKQFPKVSITYFGRQYTFENEKVVSKDYQIVSHLDGVTYYNLDTGRLVRPFSLSTIKSLLKVPKGFFQALSILKKKRPEIILSFGGYLGFPVVLAAYFLKIPVVIHEQTVSVGLSNRIIGLLAQKVLLSWESSRKYFPEKKAFLVGNPIRPELFATYSLDSFKDLPQGLKQLLTLKQKNPRLKLVLVSGGNQGSHFINELIWEVIPEFDKSVLFIHQCGQRDWEKITKKEINPPAIDFDRYYLTPWLDVELLSFIYSLTDLVISRSGANTVYELSALGKMALFIPIPWVIDNEQQKNAEILSNAGGAKILSQNGLKAQRFLNAVNEMFENEDLYQQKSAEFSQTIEKQAAAKIVAELIQIKN